VTLQQLQAICPSLIAYREPQDGESASQAMPSPGLGLKHYSPRARLILLEGVTGSEELFKLAGQLHAAGEIVGVMLPGSFPGFPFLTFEWGDLADQQELARRLFAGLRELDTAGATVILCPLPEDTGLGVAIRDRLHKAAR